jgi:flagellar basal-body rod modification protein FlgD
VIDGLSASQMYGAPGPASANGPGGALGKDEFLKILVAQLRHQDPMSPMDGSEMAVQLAQFSSVEQLVNLNESFAKQSELQTAMVNAMNSNAAVAAIGQSVLAAGDQVAVPEEGIPSVTFAVGAGGGNGIVRVFDSSGREVGKQEIGSINGGTHTIELEAATAGLEPGDYTYTVEVVGVNGKVETSTYTRAIIDGIRYTPEGPC